LAKYAELLAALLVSAVALVVDAGLLHLLTAVAGWHYLIAGAVGFIAGTVVNYLLSIRFVFAYRRVDSAILALFARGLGQHYLVGKLFAAGATFLFNFGSRRLLLFTPLRDLKSWKINA